MIVLGCCRSCLLLLFVVDVLCCCRCLLCFLSLLVLVVRFVSQFVVVLVRSC